NTICYTLYLSISSYLLNGSQRHVHQIGAVAGDSSNCLKEEITGGTTSTKSGASMEHRMLRITKRCYINNNYRRRDSTPSLTRSLQYDKVTK
ncbi:hypothetical protein LINPERPRIM_LOCUS21912, partial [Linum perenne]